MNWRGRRVTDPKPMLRTPLDDQGLKPTSGLSSVFKGMDQAKSQLRQVEHRLEEAERVDSSVAVDRIPSFTLSTSKPAPVLVDSMGKTQHLRSREEISRKISRLEEKYKDRDAQTNSQGTTRKVAWQEDKVSSAMSAGYKAGVGLKLRGSSSLDAQPGSLDQQQGGIEVAGTVLNDMSVLTRGGGVHGYLDLPDRLTRVDVGVPVASSIGRKATDSGVDPLASTFPPKSSAALSGVLSSGTVSNTDLGTSCNSAASAPVSVNATYTVNGDTSASTSPNSSRFKPKKSLKDLESSSGTLAKLREKVRQQKLLASTDESQGSSKPGHVTHDPDDVVVGRVQEAPFAKEPTAPLARKVALGPPVPRYQGFSEAEMKYRLPDGKMVKVSDIRRRKLKKLRKEAPLKEKNGPTTEGAEASTNEEKKPPKAARVVASQKKPVKSDRQVGDIITTRSWRAGAKLVLQELGPSKVTAKIDKVPASALPRTTASPPTKDMHGSDLREGSKVAHLSADARSVLQDLQEDHSGSDDHGDEKEKDNAKRAHKRKRSKPVNLETEHEGKQARVRHYDADDVKRYIARQRALRKRRLHEQQQHAQQSKEQREAQLAELYRRQREGSTGGGGRTAPRQEISNRTVTLKDVPSGRREDGVKPNNESDKENRGASSLGAWGDVSSAESSISGGSGGDVANQDRLSDEMQLAPNQQGGQATTGTTSTDVDMLIARYKTGARPTDGVEPAASLAPPSKLQSADSGLGATAASDINHYLAETGIQMDDIVSRFADRAANIGSSFGPTSVEKNRNIDVAGASTMPAYLQWPSGHVLPNQPFSASGSTVPGAKTREEKLRALCEKASLLGHRLNTERQRITALSHTNKDRWALPRDDEPAFTSRYDRMTHTSNSNYNVYNSDLPGTYADNRRGPLGGASQLHHQYESANKEEENSEMSDSTLQEEDLYKPVLTTKPSSKIRLPATNVQPPLTESGRLRVSQPGRWAEPRADPYSVFNVLSRRKDNIQRDPYKRVGILNDTEGEEEEEQQSDADRTLHSLSEQVSLSDDSTFTGDEPANKDRSTSRLASQRQSSQRSPSPVSVSQMSDSSLDNGYTNPKSAVYSVSQRSVGSHSRQSVGASLHQSSARALSQQGSAPCQSSRHSKHQSELEPASQSSRKIAASHEMSGQEDDREETLGGLVTSSSVASDISENKSEHEPLSVEVTDISESSDMSLADRTVGNRRPYAPGGVAYKPGLVSGRLSPGALERRMTAELNLLESMEESVRQLTDVDRTRGVSLAQQESVSLAQILKAQDQGHARQTAAFKRDSEFLSRELIEAHKSAAEAAEGANRTLERTRQDATQTLQESTRNLVAAQSEAARATAEAARQLAEVKVAASGAATVLQEENASRLIQQTAIATATAVTTALHDRLGSKYADREEHGTQYSRRSETSRGHADTSYTSYTSDTYDSEGTRSVTGRSSAAPTKHSETRASSTAEVETATPGTSPAGTASVATGSLVTASDQSRGNHTASTIHTEPEAEKSESIMEEVFTEKVADDYSIDFDTSVTEEDMEKSLREVLPSEHHRQRLKKTSSQSDLSSVASDDHKDIQQAVSTSSSRRLSFEGDSFTKFTVDMVRQYMREEEIRAQHQAALLKLRERALREKTQAELAWLEQQKHSVRDKGADEAYPLIKKRRRGLLLRLQQEQAEIRRLKEASRAASKERQFLLLQSREIARLQQTTKQVLAKTRHDKAKVEAWLTGLQTSSEGVDQKCMSSQVKEKMRSGGPADGQVEAVTEEDLAFMLDDSDVLSSPSREVVDSVADGSEEKKLDPKALQKLRKMKLDDKFLTHREQQLLQRRLQVEGLLEWKQKLDREEAEIEAMEKQALVLAKQRMKNEARSRAKDSKEHSTSQRPEKRGNDKPNGGTPRTPRADTIASELDSIQEESYTEMSVSTTAPQRGAGARRRTPRSEVSVPEELPDTPRTRASQSSIAEDIANGQTATSIAEDIATSRSGKRTPDSSDEANVHSSATNEDYTNETFESDAGTPTVTASGPRTAAPLPKAGPAASTSRPTSSSAAPKSPRSPLKSPARRGSESESEDSYSVAQSETTSDQSDLENRIRALSEDLKRRKLEAEKLKQEARKQQKDRLRQEEVALKKQIEAYDKYISEVKTEMTTSIELQERHPPVQPQIKRPTSGGSKRPPGTAVQSPPARPDLNDSSHSTPSRDGSGADSPDKAGPLSPIAAGDDQAKLASLADSLHDSLASPSVSATSKKTSTPEDKSRVETRAYSETVDEVIEQESVFTDIDDAGQSSVQLHLNLPEDTPGARDAPQTARSVADITEDVPTATQSYRGPQDSTTHDKSSAQEKQEERDDGPSLSQRSDRSFTYSSSQGSRSEVTYSDEFTEATTGLSSPRRRDVSDSRPSRDGTQASSTRRGRQPQPSDDNNEEESSIQTEEEVSEQLELESDDGEQQQQPVMLELRSPDLPAPEAEPEPLSQIKLGDRVLVGGAKPGTLRFKGKVSFADGFFGGVELDKPEGTNSGSRGGIEYFTCRKDCGIFVPPEKLQLLPDNWREDEQEEPGNESDVSEATVHDDADVPGGHGPRLRRDVTREDISKDVPSAEDDDSASVATTCDSELERVISSAAAAVEQFSEEPLEVEARSATASPAETTISEALPTAGESKEASQASRLEKVVDSVTDGLLQEVVLDSMASVGEAVARRQQASEEDAGQPASEPKVEKTADPKVEMATQKLLGEAITQMLSIYKKRTAGSGSASSEQQSTSVEETMAVEPAKETQPPDILKIDESPDPFKDGFSMDSKDDLDKMYDFESDEWFDDDFGLGLQKRAPPPYPGSSHDADSAGGSDLRLDLHQVMAEPFFAVPHRTDDVRQLVRRAVDVYWELRRYGEPWDALSAPPAQYFVDDGLSSSGPEVTGSGVASGRRAYKRLVFELVGELLMDIYRDEDADDTESAQPSWMPPKRPARAAAARHFRGRQPPTVMDEVLPVVEDETLRLLGLADGREATPVASGAGWGSKWTGRKKRDHVDTILLQELQQEEPDWVDYTEDETTVKMRLADTMFDSLLVETAAVFRDIAQRYARRQS